MVEDRGTWQRGTRKLERGQTEDGGANESRRGQEKSQRGMVGERGGRKEKVRRRRSADQKNSPEIASREPKTTYNKAEEREVWRMIERTGNGR